MTRVVIRDLHKLNVSTYKNLHNYSCCDGSLVVWGFSHLLKFYRLLKKNKLFYSLVYFIGRGWVEESEEGAGRGGAGEGGRERGGGERGPWKGIWWKTVNFYFYCNTFFFFFWRLHDERCVNFDFSPAEKLTRNLAPWIFFFICFCFHLNLSFWRFCQFEFLLFFSFLPPTPSPSPRWVILYLKVKF